MAKACHSDFQDAALGLLKTGATRLSVCTTQPTTYTEGITTNMLAIKTITTTDFTGPASGDTNGRKISVNSASGLTVSSTATASHVALCDTVNSKLLYVTTCTAQGLTSGNTVNVPAWDIEIADPT